MELKNIWLFLTVASAAVSVASSIVHRKMTEDSMDEKIQKILDKKMKK